MPAPANRSYSDIATFLPNRVDLQRAMAYVPAAANQIWSLGPSGGGALQGNNGLFGMFKLDPADLTLGRNYPVLRMSGFVVPNAVASGSDFTFELRRITAWGGASAANPTTAGTTIVSQGPTVTAAALVNTPSAEFVAPDVDATALVAGMYTMTVTSLATTVVNSITAAWARLQLLYV